MWGFAALPPALAVAFMVGQAFGPYMPPPVQHWGRAARSLYCNSAAEGLWPEPCIGDATADQPGFNSAPDPPTSGGKGAASAPGADCVGRDAPADMSGIPRSMLYDWLQRGGGRVGPVKEHSFPGMDTRGIVATRNLTAGDEMYRVPSALWLTETTAWNGATGQLFQRVNATREDVQGSCVIATQLLVERANPWSFWVPYVALLPDPIGVLFFDAEDTAALQSSVARGQAEGTQEYAQWFYDHRVLPAARASPELLPEDRCTEHHWRVAMTWAQARCFQVPRGASDGFEWGMVPVADMVNHQSMTANNYVTEAGSFVMRAARDVPAGAQVTITYGPKNSVQLLCNYGFVEEDNPLDKVLFRFRSGLSASRVESRLNEFERQAARSLAGLDHGLPSACSGGTGGDACGGPEAGRDAWSEARDEALTRLARGMTDGREEAVKPLGGPLGRDRSWDMDWDVAPAATTAQLMRAGRAKARGGAPEGKGVVMEEAAAEGEEEAPGQDLEVLGTLFSSGCIEPAALQTVAVMQVLDMRESAELMLHFLLGYAQSLPTSLAADEEALAGGSGAPLSPTRRLAVSFRVQFKRVLYRGVRYLDALLVAEGVPPLPQRLEGGARAEFHAKAGSALQYWSSNTQHWWQRQGVYGRQWRMQCGCARLADCSRLVLADSVLLDAAMQARAEAHDGSDAGSEGYGAASVSMEEKLRQGRPLSVVLEPGEKMEAVHWAASVHDAESVEEIELQLPLGMS